MIAKISRYINLNITDLLFLILLLCTTFIVWKGVLSQTIEGEGYYYFSPTISLISPEGKLTDIVHGYDNFSKVAFYLQEQTFGSNIQNYMITEVVIILIVGVCFYLFIRAITKNSGIAFLGALYQSVYYTGNFQIYARGHLQWFYQRVPEVIPILISIYFLDRFLKDRNIGKYILSFCFFVLALYFTHYATFFLPFYVGYISVNSLLGKGNIKEKLANALFLVPFVTFNYFLTKGAGLNLSTIHPNQSLLESFLTLKEVPQKILFQLTVVTVPFAITQFISNATRSTYQMVIQTLTIPTLLGYVLILGNLYKTKSTYFKLVVAVLLALVGALFLNIYFNRVIVFNEIEQGRYYFVPGFYVGIVVAIFLHNLFRNTKRAKFAIILLCVFWVLTNTKFIWKKISDSQVYYDRNKAMYTYLEKNKTTLPEGSLVFVNTSSNSFSYLNKYYSNDSATYVYLDSKWKSKIPEDFDVNKIFVYDYGKDNNVVDLSSEYRSKLGSDRN